jgi:rfaE bifunctional protein nucleotidyltransferase chain/domain
VTIERPANDGSRKGIVLANGCFDLLHLGHVRHLQAAKAMGTFLIVAVTRDRSVNKGPGRPVFNQYQRQEMLHALRYVTGTILVDSSLEALEEVKPAVFVKGREYDGRMRGEDELYCKLHGIEIAFTDEEVWSSTKLIKDHFGTVGG